MNRPLLSLSIVDLIEKFDAANGDVIVALELVKELRHRNTPKAIALNNRVLEVFAANASGRLFQSLLLPELEIMYKSFLGVTGVRDSLVEVLESRTSAKSGKLLDLVKASANPKEPEKVSNSQLNSQKKGEQESAVLGAPCRCAAGVGDDVQRALCLFELTKAASWGDVETARQKLVFKYRPNSGVAVPQANEALKEISSAYAVLANYMQGRY